MRRVVIDTNYLQNDALHDYFSESRDSIAIITPFVQMEMFKGDAIVNVAKSTEILSKHSGQVVLTKSPTEITSLKGRKKGTKKRLTGGRRTSAFRRWSQHTRPLALAGEKRSIDRIERSAEAARMQLADMRENADSFQNNIEEVRNRYSKDELDSFRSGAPFSTELAEKIESHAMETTQQFYEAHPDKLLWPPRDEVLYNFMFRFALCARIHALYVISKGLAKNPERLPNDFIDVSVAAYATLFDGLLSNDEMTQEIYQKARSLLDDRILQEN